MAWDLSHKNTKFHSSLAKQSTMSDVSLHQLLVLFTWFPLAALLFISLLIARTYQKFSGVQTYFWLYTVVGILFGVMSVRYASVGLVISDAFSDIFAGIAGVLLLALFIRLYVHMISDKPKYD